MTRAVEAKNDNGVTIQLTADRRVRWLKESKKIQAMSEAEVIGARAMIAIEEESLYLDGGFKSFTECVESFGYSAQRVAQLTQIAKTVDGMQLAAKNPETVSLPEKGAVVLTLAKCAPDDKSRLDAWQEAVEVKGDERKVTAKYVKAVCEQKFGEQPKKHRGRPMEAKTESGPQNSETEVASESQKSQFNPDEFEPKIEAEDASDEARKLNRRKVTIKIAELTAALGDTLKRWESMVRTVDESHEKFPLKTHRAVLEHWRELFEDLTNAKKSAGSLQSQWMNGVK